MKIGKIPFYWQTVVAMVAGALIGGAFGENVSFLGDLAHWIVNLIKALATPLLFLSIFDAILNAQFRGRGVASMFAISGINALFAITIGLVISNVYEAGTTLGAVAEKVTGLKAHPTDLKQADWIQSFGTFIPESTLGPFVRNAIPAVILLAVILALAAKKYAETDPEGKKMYPKLCETTRFLLGMHHKALEWVCYLVPLAIFGSVAKVIGAHGVEVLGGLGAYVLVVFVGMLIHVLFVYQTWIRIIAKKSLRAFWREAKEPVIYAFGVNSSLATLPVTLRSLDRYGVSPSAARLSACVGTNFNNDGILLYEVMAAMFIAQAYGLHLSIFQQLALSVVCVIATVGVAGIPEAGIISLTLVLSTAGLPSEAIPLLLTVDWFLARCRSVVNVLGDMTVAVGIDKLNKTAVGLHDPQNPHSRPDLP